MRVRAAVAQVLGRGSEATARGLDAQPRALAPRQRRVVDGHQLVGIRLRKGLAEVVVDQGTESVDLLTPEVHTASDHACFRLRRTGGYSALELDAFAKHFTLLAQERDVYVYFKHEDEPTGALNAADFLGRTVTAEDKL